MPGMEMLGPTTKPSRRFRIFHRTRGGEENEGGGLGRNAIFAGQPRPDVMIRVGTGTGRSTDRGIFQYRKGHRPSVVLLFENSKTPIGYRRPLSSPSAISLPVSTMDYRLIVV